MHLRLRDTVKWAWFGIKLLPFSSSANAQNLLTTLETIVLKRFYRFLVAQETP